MSRELMRRWMAILLAAVMMVSLIHPSNEVHAAESLAPVDHTEHEEPFIAWGSEAGEKTTLPSAPGSYYLTDDITLSESWQVPEGTTLLCLNGHNITLGTGINISVNRGDNPCNLTICDCTDTSSGASVGSITGGSSADSAGAINIGGIGSLTMYGGCITGNTGKMGGGVFLDSGIFKMYGGNITNNEVVGTGCYGGGIALGAGACFYMYGGTIANNKSGETGGGISSPNGSNATTEIYGGVITGNEADMGGGIYIDHSFLYLYDGEISNNTARLGAGLFVNSYSEFTMRDGSINGNISSSDGCAIYVANGSSNNCIGNNRPQAQNNSGYHYLRACRPIFPY